MHARMANVRRRTNDVTIIARVRVDEHTYRTKFFCTFDL
jgi:hypothetical protein